MRLIVPYVRDGQAQAVRKLGERLGGEFYDLTGNDTAYFALLRDLWKAGEAFALVEMDIVPPPDFLAELARCPQAWCCFPFPQMQALKSPDGQPRGRLRLVLDWGLGATKFSAGLLAREPDVMARVGI